MLNVTRYGSVSHLLYRHIQPEDKVSNEVQIILDGMG